MYLRIWFSLWNAFLFTPFSVVEVAFVMGLLVFQSLTLQPMLCSDSWSCCFYFWLKRLQEGLALPCLNLTLWHHMHAGLNKLKRFILDLTLSFTSYMTLKKKSGFSAQKLIYLWPQRILTRKIKDDAYENSQKSLSDTSCYGLNLSLVLVIILGFKVSYYASNFH